MSPIAPATALSAEPITGAEKRDLAFASHYADLQRMAERELRRNAATTLNATALVHDTYVNLSQRASLSFQDHGQFMAYAARAMRGLLVDHLRKRATGKRGGDLQIVSLPADLPHAQEDTSTLRVDRLNEALQFLEEVDPRLAQCVNLRFFCGFSCSEIAAQRYVTERTVQRDWERARILLYHFMNRKEVQSGPSIVPMPPKP